ncbi:hypothetical protein [Actinoallomurus liliacearum]
MPLTRRSVLFGSAAFAFGLATTSCGRAGSPSTHAGSPGKSLGSPSTDPSAPIGEEVVGALRGLAKEVGRETFQSVEVSTDPRFDRTLNADLLMVDGSVQTFTYNHSWKKGDYDAKSEFTSPASARIDELPLEHLQAYLNVLRGEAHDITFKVDYVGRVQVTALVNTDEVGLKLDGTGTVPHCDPDKVAGVKSAVAEMVAVYGRAAERVGSFNGFVHMDANVAGCRAPVRIVRRQKEAAQADIVQDKLFSRSELFDPRGFDPTMAVTRKATIAKEAGVKGEVWDWEYRRPPKGGEPLVSYGIGPKGSSTRVWLDEKGKITAIVAGECKSDSGWCPE